LLTTLAHVHSRFGWTSRVRPHRSESRLREGSLLREATSIFPRQI
jgi:hypothetical protein